MKAIHQYFEDFYVPNNMAMILVGDLDFEETISLVNQYFGKFQYKELPKKEKIVEAVSYTHLDVYKRQVTVCLEGRCSIQLSYAPLFFSDFSSVTVPI